MASRYAETKVVDYCYHPIRVRKDGVDIVVPCQKCDGCLLHKANEWSMRCGMEIEATPATIFGSLTYSNRYYPKLYPFVGSQFMDSSYRSFFDFKDDLSDSVAKHLDSVVWCSDHPENIRFNGVQDVLREDNLIIKPKEGFYFPIDISHWDNFNKPAIGYASKRDIQLWLKLLRRYLDETISYKSKRVLERGYFRYFIISEIGPTTFRGHYHFLLFCQSNEVSEALLGGALFENWKMCDKDRFDSYVHLCDSGARGYVTQYLTCFSSLPRVYREAKEVRPFRLASKAPAIGYIEQDSKKIFEDVSRGVIKYTRSVARLESASVLCYPKNFCVTLFPKCYQYSKLSDSRRFFIYSYLFKAVREFGYSYFLLSYRLSQSLHASDYLAMRACYRFCKKYVNSPLYYYYLLDNYYYQVDMENLRSFYSSQEQLDFNKFPELIFEYYPNIEVLCCETSGRYSLDYLNNVNTLNYLLSPLGFDVSYLLGNKKFFEDLKKYFSVKNEVYKNEVSDIVKNMVKTSKFNELTGNAPTIV